MPETVIFNLTLSNFNSVENVCHFLIHRAIQFYKSLRIYSINLKFIQKQQSYYDRCLRFVSG
jgi:hypothetical protein